MDFILNKSTSYDDEILPSSRGWLTIMLPPEALKEVQDEIKNLREENEKLKEQNEKMEDEMKKKVIKTIEDWFEKISGKKLPVQEEEL